MFCNNCGKEISNQAKFCNHCGAQVSSAQPQSQPVPQAAHQSVPQPAQPQKKKTNPFVTICVAVFVFFLVRGVTMMVMSPKSSSSAHSTTTTTTQVSSTGDLTSSCYNGALYQNGYLTYGLARWSIPGYSVQQFSSNERDYLASPNQSTLFSTTKQYEANCSYDATDKNSILNSYRTDKFSNVSMISFSKSIVDGYPTVRYIISCTVNGTNEYIGEMIIMPSKTPSESLRLCGETLASNGYAHIDRVFDTLDISSAYKLSNTDTGVFGLDRIVEK